VEPPGCLGGGQQPLSLVKLFQINISSFPFSAWQLDLTNPFINWLITATCAG